MTKHNEDYCYIIKKKEDDTFNVLKIQYNDEGIVTESDYTVTRKSCTCKAFSIHGHCKHIDMIFVHAFPSSLMTTREAQAYLNDWTAALQKLYQKVWSPDEPFTKNRNNKVTEIHINVSEPHEETMITRGKWSGKLKGSGVIGVMHVI